jgi:hypothetical protein
MQGVYYVYLVQLDSILYFFYTVWNSYKILEQVVNHMIWTTKKHTGPQAYV